MILRLLTLCSVAALTVVASESKAQDDEKKNKQVRVRLVALTKAVEAFALKNKGEFPDNLEVLAAGKLPFLETDDLLDPWGQRFMYDKSGRKNHGEWPDIWTNTPNKETFGNWTYKPKLNLVRLQYEANLKVARDDIAVLSKACTAYKAKSGRFPMSLDELTAGKKPFVDEEALLDPWGRIYHYDPDGAKNEGKVPDIWTTTPRTDEINNWQKDKKK